MTLAALDWGIVLGYLSLAFIVSSLFAKKGGESVTSYFVSGRSLPWWLAGTSMVATSFACDTPLLITGWMRSGGGVRANWYWWSFLFGHVLAVFVFARLWRRSAVLTNIEITELRFSGRPAAALRMAKSLYNALPINLFVIVWCTLAMQKILEATLDVPREWAMAACLGISVVYCVFSGFWGVVAMEIPQFLLALTGAVALAWTAVTRAGGVPAMLAKLDVLYGSGHGLTDLLPSFHGTMAATNSWLPGWWSPAVSGFSVYVGVLWWSSKNVDGGGALIQRMLACKDERHATYATLLFTVLHYAGRTWPWVMAALASFVLLPLASTGAPADPLLAGFAERVGKDPELAYPVMIALLPVGLKGVLLASLFAAFTSTVDSYLNLSASYLLNDLYRRFLRPSASERHYVRVSRALVILLATIATCIAYTMTSINDVFTFLLAFSSGIGFVYMARWFWWRINAWSEIAAMCAAGTVSCAIALLPHAPALFARFEMLRTDLRFDAGPFTILLTVLSTVTVTLIVTLLTPPEERATLREFYRRVRPGGFWGPIAREVAELNGAPSMAGRASVAVTLAACMAACVLVIGTTVAIGDVVLGRGLDAIAPAAPALAALAGLIYLTRSGRLGITREEI